MRFDKKGQFYLLAAVVIITIILGFATVNNMLKRGGDVRLSDTGEELDFESAQVLEYGVVGYAGDTNELIEHFTTSYESYAGAGKKIIFIIGDSSDLPSLNERCCTYRGDTDCHNGCSVEAFTYTDLIIGEVGLNIGGGGGVRLSIPKKDKEIFSITTTGYEEITINHLNQDYVFDIKPGENFYFVLYQTIDGEEYVVTN